MRAPITLRGAEKLRVELRKLKGEDRPAIIRAIAEARSHGDLSENAEYHAAREQQGFIEGRIKEIEQRLADAQVIDPASLTDYRQGRLRRNGRTRARGWRAGAPLPDRWRRRGGHQERPAVHQLADRAGADRAFAG